MKAIILNKAGNAEDLLLTDIEKPTIKDDEVLIKTVSLSINPVDYKTRSNENMITRFYGDERPVILGWDISGTIEATGKNVTGFKTGDHVFGMINFPGNGSAYAEYVAAPADQLALKPASVSHDDAAAATLAALTAWQALVTTAKIKKGDKVLIHAASGGVGHYATQIAKHFGAYVIGTSSVRNKDFVLQQGADEHIDYTTENFEEKLSNIDIVLNPVSNDINGRSVTVTKPGGKIVYILGAIAPEHLEAAKAKNIEATSILVQSSGSDMKELATLLDTGAIKSHISQKFAFAEIAEAHRQMETDRTVGKTVINL